MHKIVLLMTLTTLYLVGNIGQIMALKGHVKIKRLSNLTLTAFSGMKIKQGDEIITSSKTRTQIILKDDTIITIGSNSSFSFEKYHFDGTKKSLLKMRANRGFFRSITGKIGKIAPQRFQVETSSATIGIRGTDFSVRIQEAIGLYSCKCYSGQIRVFLKNAIKDVYAGEVFSFKLKDLEKGTYSVNQNQYENSLDDLMEIKKVPTL